MPKRHIDHKFIWGSIVIMGILKIMNSLYEINPYFGLAFILTVLAFRAIYEELTRRPTS